MTNGPEQVGRLPDEAFASNARRPNPSFDEHVAFPDETPTATPAASSLPLSAWAPHRQPHQQQLPEQQAMLPSEVAAVLTSIATRQRPRSRSRGRLSPAGLGLAVVVALALILGSNTDVPSDEAARGLDQGWSQEGVRAGGTDGGLALVTLADGVDATIQPLDQPRHEIPLGPSTIRFEVVGDDPAVDVVVTSDSGDAQLGEVVLPFGAGLRLQERPDQLTLTARSPYGEAEIQCRVYADDRLVSIASGQGLAECAVTPAG